MPAHQSLRANVIPRYTFAHDTDLPLRASRLAQGLPEPSPDLLSCKPSDAHLLEKLLAVLVVVDATVALVVE